MDWDELMTTLNAQQEYLQAIVRASKEEQERERPGTDFDGILSSKPRILFNLVKNNQAHPSMPLAAMASAQIEFNRAVITLLTDLDHRKSEPSS